MSCPSIFPLTRPIELLERPRKSPVEAEATRIPVISGLLHFRPIDGFYMLDVILVPNADVSIWGCSGVASVLHVDMFVAELLQELPLVKQCPNFRVPRSTPTQDRHH